MKLGLGAIFAALIATAGFAQAPASALTISAKPAIAASASTQVTFWKKGDRKRSAHRAHKRHKHVHAHKHHAPHAHHHHSKKKHR